MAARPLPHLRSSAITVQPGSLLCGFCQHQWAVPRIFCPACEARDTGTFNYFFSDEEPEYRVYTCESCRFYLKTVDLRRLARPFYPPAETLLTLHLDIQAQEQGFQSDSADPQVDQTARSSGPTATGA